MEELLNIFLLVNVIITEPCHLLLFHCLAGMIDADLCHDNCVLCLLGGLLVCMGGCHFWRNLSENGLRCPRLSWKLTSTRRTVHPHFPCLHLHLHHQAPFVVVHLREQGQQHTPNNLLDHGLDDRRSVTATTSVTTLW